MTIKPIADRVLVEPEAPEKVIAGIIIPDTATERPMKGIAIEVGPGRKDEPMTVKKGDTVLFGKYAGTEITVEGKSYILMRETDIYAII